MLNRLQASRTLSTRLGTSLVALALAACASSPTGPSGVGDSGAPAAAPTSDELVPFASDESARRLARSTAKVDFFVLANHYEGQQNGAACGPTSAVIVANALRVGRRGDLPGDPTAIPEPYRARLSGKYDPTLHRYTQRGFFADPKVAAVKSEAAFFGTPAADGAAPDPGFQLRQIGGALAALGLDVQVRPMDDAVSDEVALAELVANLAHPDDYVIVNYARPVLGQKGGGHISPLGAYDAASRSFLVLDVNPNDGKTWVWVPASKLLAAMRTHDTVENRGYLLVREGAAP